MTTTTTEKTVREFILNDTLTTSPLNPTTIEILRKGASTKEELVLDMITSSIHHRNYLDYLSLAWNHHYGVVVTPDILWYMVLCELAGEVKNSPEQYRSLFTDKADGKQEIRIQSGSDVDMPVDDLIAALRDYVPTDMNTFLPKFTTSSYMSEFAFYTSFADMVSPFYNYSMFMCGIPKVKVMGKQSDYDKLLLHVLGLKKVFTNNKVLDYLKGVENIFRKIADGTIDWNEMFSLERCGSGSQVEVEGWITNIYMNVPSVGYPGNFSSHISSIEYKNLSTNKNFKKYVGLFGSDVSPEDYLVPEFGYYVNEIKE